MTNQPDELRGAIAKLVAKWREDHLNIGGAVYCGEDGSADYAYVCAADELEVAARQAAESPGPAISVTHGAPPNASPPSWSNGEWTTSEAVESPGRAGWQMSQQIAAAERSLAEVSADAQLELAAIIGRLREHVSYAEDSVDDPTLYEDIGKLCNFAEGTFSLRASGTPDYRNELLAIDSLIPRKAGDNRSVYSRMLELSGAKGPQSTVQAAAPTLSEAGADYGRSKSMDKRLKAQGKPEAGAKEGSE